MTFGDIDIILSCYPLYRSGRRVKIGTSMYHGVKVLSFEMSFIVGVFLVGAKNNQTSVTAVGCGSRLHSASETTII